MRATSLELEITMYVLMLGSILVAAIVGITLWRIQKLRNEIGGVASEFNRSFSGTFLMQTLIALVVIYLLKLGLEKGIANLNVFLFATFPYIAMIIFLLGSIYRYRNIGFKVSSLSSQFLESKQLFWGSQPFHWGLVVLFFGHLIAFLFPRGVLLWNSIPIRLLILEITAFVFGLLALLGLVLLIKRRLGTKSIIMVTNKMDILIYVMLLIQIISGLFVAFFTRWGSSWFAGVLTPYLRSIFSFDPNIEAVSALPFEVQLHILVAFFILAIIPFTRFMHILVAPIDYLWRNYQVVIWNWNRKEIRLSSKYFPGKKIINH